MGAPCSHQRTWAEKDGRSPPQSLLVSESIPIVPGAAFYDVFEFTMEKLSHYNPDGSAHMVDVSDKPPTRREAEAFAFVVLSESVLAALPQNPKGNPLEVARFAGIQAAKRTADLIPMCHPLPLSFIDVSATVVTGGVEIHSSAATVAGTGVEMEALTAAAVAALTVYDMCKALDKSIVIREIALVRKSGGKSGEYIRT
jgi:cyclic pyranopterin phosphate synthase